MLYCYLYSYKCVLASTRDSTWLTLWMCSCTAVSASDLLSTSSLPVIERLSTMATKQIRYILLTKWSWLSTPSWILPLERERLLFSICVFIYDYRSYLPFTTLCWIYPVRTSPLYITASGLSPIGDRYNEVSLYQKMAATFKYAHAIGYYTLVVCYHA